MDPIVQLETDAEKAVFALFNEHGFMTKSDIRRRTRFGIENIETAIQKLIAADIIQVAPNSPDVYTLSKSELERLSGHIITMPAEQNEHGGNGSVVKKQGKKGIKWRITLLVICGLSFIMTIYNGIRKTLGLFVEDIPDDFQFLPVLLILGIIIALLMVSLVKALKWNKTIQQA